MRSLLTVLLFSAFCFGHAYANPQQEKMKSCNASAGEKNLKGDERKSFMKTCLSGTPEASGNPQQLKMKSCNAEAGKQALSGDARKAFMKTCLSGH